ncbi:MAG: sugar ABC transporter permease [Firmicutes bacterium]|nr:sugar ABC transporter permease [Bacillota bacterium]
MNRTSLEGRGGLWPSLRRDLNKYKYVYLMAIPVVAYYIIFHYVPMYGAIIAFKDFSPMLGIIRSPWVGFKHFRDFFQSFYFWRLMRNTILLSTYQLVFGFPAPIVLALLLNEVKNQFFKKSVQTITYLPHFISLVVVCGMIKDFTMSGGLINDIIAYFGGERAPLLQDPGLFRTIYVVSGIWQEIGWGSIIFLAALAAIDQELYEAAAIDGAGRFRQAIHVTLPGIMPTIVILLILRLGRMLSVGFEKIILLYNPATYETADVISTFVYRRGLQEFSWSFSSAVGLFNSAINFILLIAANKISQRLEQTTLW